jgi:hypothetical protein
MMKSWHIPMDERHNGSYGLLLLGNEPRFFKFLPLVNSTNVGVPAVFHSSSFSTTEDRDGFDLEHVDDIRYRIRSEIWENEAVSLTGFVDWLGKQLPGLRHL